MKFYKKRWIQSGIALICSLAIVLSVFPVLADNDEIENLENQSSSLESELQGINEDILALSDEISTTEMQVEMLNGEIARTSDELNTGMQHYSSFSSLPKTCQTFLTKLTLSKI